IETGPAQKIATHGAASSAARGEHERNNNRGSYKSWAMSGDDPNSVPTRSSNSKGRHLHSAGNCVAKWVLPWTSTCDGPDARTTTSCGEPLCRPCGTTSRRTSARDWIAASGKPKIGRAHV